MHPKVYYTLLVYFRAGQESVFEEYENKVLPLLPKYQGKLELRLKTTKPIAEHPHEVHVVSFPAEQNFEAYRLDPERASYATLFNFSVEKMVLIKGVSVPVA
jgi:hypothetical protein